MLTTPLPPPALEQMEQMERMERLYMLPSGNWARIQFRLVPIDTLGRN